MNATMKNSLKSAAILIAIAVVAVLSLALANALLPKYEAKLDMNKLTILNSLAPSGVDDQTALDERYFVMLDFDVEDFNKTKTIGGANDKVLAVYRAENGESAGTVFVETSTSGNAPGMNIITAIKDGKIVGIDLMSSNESSGYTDFSKVKELVKGQGSVTVDMLKPAVLMASGATYSSNGYVKGFSLAFAVYNVVGEGA